MTVLFNDVTLAFTNNMTRMSDYGNYSYSFIIDREQFCETVRDTLALQKKPVWDSAKNTDEFILEKCNARTRNLVKHEHTKEMMKDSDILVTVKSKEAPIENNKRANLAPGSVCDILIDVFEFEYAKRQFICVRSHAERGCTIKAKKLLERKDSTYFEYEEKDDKGLDLSDVSMYIKEPASKPKKEEDAPSNPF